MTINSSIIFSSAKFLEKYSSWIEHIPFAFFLIEKLKPRVFVELGTHYGGSYFAFCQAINESKTPTKAYAIDTWFGDEHAGFYNQDVFEYVNKINLTNFSHFSNLLKMSFDEANNLFENNSIDLLHIDGFHTYDAVKNDFENWLPKMSDTGVMIFHDTAVKSDDFGVWKLMKELKEKYLYFEFEHGYGLGILCIGSKINEFFLNFIKTANSNEYIKNLFSSIGRKNLLEYQNKIHAEKINILTDNIQLITESLKFHYPIQEIIYFDEKNNSFIFNNIFFSQLYFKKPDSEYTENQSIKTNIKQNCNKISFKFKQPTSVYQLRFDPLNDYVKIRIINIQFLLNGISLETEIILTSNAFKNENNVYLFDTTDSQVFIDFPEGKTIELDEVNIEIDFLQSGYNAISQILIEKDIDLKQSQNINHKELRKINEELHLKKEELKQKTKELNLMYNSKSWKLTKPLRLLAKLSFLKKYYFK